MSAWHDVIELHDLDKDQLTLERGGVYLASGYMNDLFDKPIVV
jgi:hypothetical protein